MNQEQRAHIAKSLEAGVRLDGRKFDEFRKVEIDFDVSSTAEGSAQVRFGDSEVIAGVKMNLGTPYPDTPDSGVLMVQSELLPMANPKFESGPPSIDAIEIARVIDKGIRESKSFDTKKLCVTPGEKVWMVQVDVEPINFDGNMMTIGGVAALAALMTARYPAVDDDGKVDYHQSTDKKLELDHYPIPVMIGKVGDQLVVDPTQEEEEALDARLTIIVMENDKLCALQKGGDHPLSIDDIHRMVDLAVVKSAELRKMIEEATK